MKMNVSAEIALIRAFVVPSRRQRWLELIGTKRGRTKLRTELAHCETDLDLRFARELRPEEGTVDEILAILVSLGGGSTCIALSEDDELDGRALELRHALSQVVDSQLGTFLSVNPGKLAYFEGENASPKYVLIRDDR
jgi:hypothetical protein